MFSSISKVAAVALGLLTVGQAAPAASTEVSLLSKRSFSCSSLVTGLNSADCQHMSNIGMHSQGINPTSNNGIMWIGSGGANLFSFYNNAGVDVALVMWYCPPNTYTCSFVNAYQAEITISIAAGATKVISVANGISGAFAGLYNDITILNSYGQVYNTWGEFTTGGDYATFDVSREVNMGGNSLTMSSSTCTSNMSKCVWECNTGNSCETGYSLINCAAGSQTSANPGGGCMGISNGGNVAITFAN